jgi:aconitate hydratase
VALNVAQKLIQAHLTDGDLTPGAEIGLRVDQTLTQDATGTMVMLELEALGLDRARTDVSVQCSPGTGSRPARSRSSWPAA